MRKKYALLSERDIRYTAVTLSLSKVRIIAYFVKLEKYGTFDDVISACGQFTDKNSHAPLEVASRRLDVAVGALK